MDADAAPWRAALRGRCLAAASTRARRCSSGPQAGRRAFGLVAGLLGGQVRLQSGDSATIVGEAGALGEAPQKMLDNEAGVSVIGQS